MFKFCRECDCVMAGDAAFCPRCGERWRQPFDHSLAEAADLFQPPVHCTVCRKQLTSPRFFCPRCGADVEPFGPFPPDELWESLEAPQ